MYKTSQSTQQTVLPELVSLRNSIVNFHQNMKIVYDKLKTSAGHGVIPQALLEAYKPYLEKVATMPVFGPSFTTTQMNQHLRYLEGIVKKFASINAMSQESFAAKYGKQPYYQNILLLGKKVKELFTPVATGIKSSLPDDQLIKAASTMDNLFDKVGADFVTVLNSYLIGLTPTNTLGRVMGVQRISIEKLAKQIESYYQLTCNW